MHSNWTGIPDVTRSLFEHVATELGSQGVTTIPASPASFRERHDLPATVAYGLQFSDSPRLVLLVTPGQVHVAECSAEGDPRRIYARYSLADPDSVPQIIGKVKELLG